MSIFTMNSEGRSAGFSPKFVPQIQCRKSNVMILCLASLCDANLVSSGVKFDRAFKAQSGKGVPNRG